MLCPLSARFQGQIVSISEKPLVLSPKGERFPGHVELDAAVRQGLQQVPGAGRSTLACMQGLDRAQGRAPRSVIHWAAIVGVDQAVIPKFVALVDVRHPGGRELEQDLRQAV